MNPQEGLAGRPLCMAPNKILLLVFSFAGLTEEMWELCKGPFKMQMPINPHISTCDTPKITKLIRFSISSKSYLSLMEVAVTGFPAGGKSCCSNPVPQLGREACQNSIKQDSDNHDFDLYELA